MRFQHAIRAANHIHLAQILLRVGIVVRKNKIGRRRKSIPPLACHPNSRPDKNFKGKI